MDRSLDGKVGLVTGAARRVGRAIALRLAREGMAVAIHYHRSRDEAESLLREIVDAGGVARAFAADLAAPGGPAELARSVLSSFGRVHLLVNSASIWLRTPVLALDPEEFDRTVAVNLRSPFLLAALLGRSMKENGEGLIVNVLDWSIDRPYPDYIPYGITKAGLAAATRGLARALAPEVRVNAVAPGAVLLPEGTDAEEAEAARRATALRRIGDPADVAEAVVYFLRAPFTTGATLVVDGGRSLR